MFSSRKLLNVGIRGGTLISKFLLIFLIAIFFKASDVGMYGLITSTIGYALYVFGFDFYVYSGRELIGNDNKKIGSMIKDQFVLFFISYIFIMPFFLIVFFQEFIPWSYALLFFLILVLDHLGQELNRVFVALSHQLWASVLLFVRSGLWCLVAMLMMWLNPETRSLSNLLFFWTLGSALSSILGVYVLIKKGYSGWSSEVDWQWIKSGIQISMPYFLTTLLLQLLFTADRYIIKIYFENEILGAYVLFSSFSFAIATFVDAGAFVFYYPELIQTYKLNNRAEFKRKFNQMTKSVLTLVTLLSLLGILLVKPILQVAKKEIYLQNLSLFYVLLLAVWFQVVGWIPQYGLYAQKKDKEIIICNLLTSVLFFPIFFLLLNDFGKHSVGISMGFTFFIALVLKVYFFRKTLKD